MEETLAPSRDTLAPASLLDVRTVASLLGCSARHVYRLADAGRMPGPVRLGSLVRWNRSEVERWIQDGCPTCARQPRPK
jgi:excisionase family DNA binding protein